MDGTLVIATALAVIVLVLVSQGIKVVQPYQRMVVLRLGKADASSVRGPGLAFLIPVIDHGVPVDVREQSITVGSRGVTKDNATLSTDLELSWRITDPLRSVVSVANLRGALEGVSASTFRDVVFEMSRADALAQRDVVINRVRTALETITARWGVQVTRLDMGELADGSPTPG